MGPREECVRFMAWRLAEWIFALLVILMVVGLGLLGGCATTPIPEKPIVTRIVTEPAVKIPVPVKCVTADQVPPIPGTILQKDFGRDDTVIGLRADIKEMQVYSVTADGLLRGCLASQAALPTEAEVSK